MGANKITTNLLTIPKEKDEGKRFLRTMKRLTVLIRMLLYVKIPLL